MVGRDVVGIRGDNAAISDNRVSTNDTQYEFRRKALAVLAEGSDMVIADKVVDLGFELDESLRCCFFHQRPGTRSRSTNPDHRVRA